MKKLIYLILLILGICTVAIAATLPTDGNNNLIQSPAFNGALTQTLTAPSSVVDMSQNIAYSVYCAAVSKERAMFGNYTKSQKYPFVQSTIPATTWHTAWVSKTTPFVNISGCAGQLRIH